MIKLNNQQTKDQIKDLSFIFNNASPKNPIWIKLDSNSPKIDYVTLDHDLESLFELSRDELLTIDQLGAYIRKDSPLISDEIRHFYSDAVNIELELNETIYTKDEEGGLGLKNVPNGFIDTQRLLEVFIDDIVLDLYHKRNDSLVDYTLVTNTMKSQIRKRIVSLQEEEDEPVKTKSLFLVKMYDNGELTFDMLRRHSLQNDIGTSDLFTSDTTVVRIGECVFHKHNGKFGIAFRTSNGLNKIPTTLFYQEAIKKMILSRIIDTFR